MSTRRPQDAAAAWATSALPDCGGPYSRIASPRGGGVEEDEDEEDDDDDDDDDDDNDI